MALPAQPTPVIGRVASVNPKGIRLEGEDSWLNVSKFGSDVVLPERGQTVSVLLDARGFIRSLIVVDADVSGHGSAAPSRVSAAPSTKDRTITRLAVLRSAVQLAQGRDDLCSADVLKVAERFEAWVYRSDGETMSDD